MCLSALENKTIIKDFRTRYKDSNYDTIALCELFSELYIDILTNLIGSEPLELSTPQEIFDNAIELLKELNSGKNIVTGVTINGEDIEFDYDPILSEKCKYLSPRCYDPDIDAE
jgi:hypothetical protein